jgi:spermidine synthase
MGTWFKGNSMGWYFGFFFLSGFCSILYEVIWLRLTMAQYGVTTALTAITLSMFMLGMGAGSWLAGDLVRRKSISGRDGLRLYALSEFLIGCSSLAVPAELILGHRLLGSFTGNASMSSGAYYLASGTLVALTLLPWCVCMGATYPLAMAAIEKDAKIESRRSFSYLYLSNVIGALAGAIAPLFLIESYGFHKSLSIGTMFNAVIAVSAYGLSFAKKDKEMPAQSESGRVEKVSPRRGAGMLILLFLTGLSTMGMEVIWIRLFMPYAGPVVYSFALILAFYLAATFVGSILYRSASRNNDPENPLAWVILALVGLLPVCAFDPRIPLDPLMRAGLGIVPFAVLIGFLTPLLVDRWSGGDPERAGRAYAVNVLGCIVGPLLSGFILLPFLGEHLSMLIYALPWMAMAFIPNRGSKLPVGSRIAGYAVVLSAILLFLVTKDHETIYPQREVLRDSTATVIATGTGMNKRLLTNGFGITKLTPITKMMAHLTLASLHEPPRNALIICFGMGTTFRSAMSWGISATAVELVPSVPRLFSYYHSDADRVLQSPRAHVVVDDGRRFLERSSEKFDVILIDPPPPVAASASSLLYSVEFYRLARARLQPDGILQQWLPVADSAVQASVAKALKSSFPYVKVYGSLEGWGSHFLASNQPIPEWTAAQLVAHMPSSAVTDMMEWGPAATPVEQFQRVLSTESTVDPLIALSPRTPALTDDRPINEYYLLRDLAAAEHRTTR